MLHALSIWLLVAGFFGAGLFNAISSTATKSSFVRWGYPAMVGPRHRRIGGGDRPFWLHSPSVGGVPMILGAAIIAAAVLTVLRHREFTPPRTLSNT